MKRTKAQKGITLVALIITIIVLLILAMVTINAVMDDGIIKHAKHATNKHEEEQSKEKVALALNEWKIVKYTQSDTNLGDFLTGKFGEENVKQNEAGTYTVTVDKYNVTVSLDGNITGVTGNNNSSDNNTENEETENIPEVITTYTVEEIEADEHLYAIGKTVSTYVVAKFNDDYTQVTITKNGEDSDGLIKDFAPWIGDKSPMEKHKDTLQIAVVEKGIVNTGDGMFYQCAELTSIIIPYSVTRIGQHTFWNCTNLNNVSIPDNVISIGNGVYYNTGYYNNSSNWEDNVLYIGNYLIEANDSISGSYIIKEGTKVIAARAFESCTSLTNITIPNNVTKIDKNTFSGCSNLSSITIPNSVTSIDEYAFSNCTGLTSVIISENVTSIGASAFSDCTGLTSITIPNSVISIESSTFSGCTGLTSVTIPDKVTSIGASAFSNCTGLISITIPDKVTSIGASAFYNCTGLTSVTIPSSVETIGEGAFSRWTKEQTINCRAKSKPNGWNERWNASYIDGWREGECTVNWGYTGE